MTKKNILQIIAKKEINRLQNLSNTELLIEFNCWFNTDNIKMDKNMLIDLINDFMNYRDSESLTELKTYLNK